MKRWLVLFLLLSVGFSKELVLSLNQSDYYFQVGQPAVLILRSDNPYSYSLNGNLVYTITQHVVQQGFMYSSTNMQSIPMTIPSGKKDLPLNFGTSKNPADLDVNLEYDYSGGKVSLGGIHLHFVSGQTPQQKTTPIKSSYQSQPKQQTPPFSKSQPNVHQRAEDSSALKKQIQKQLNSQKQMKNAFGKNLANNERFQKAHENLLKQGYNLTSYSFSPQSNKTGSFELNYTGRNGERASLKGFMRNESVKFRKWTSEDKEKYMEKLNQSHDFQRIVKNLQKQGFALNKTSFEPSLNSTTIKLDYLGKNNETRTVVAQFVNQSLKRVEVQSSKKKGFPWWLLLFSVVPFLFKRKEATQQAYRVPIVSRDLKKEAGELIETAEKLFKQGKKKDACVLLSRARQLLKIEKSLDWTECDLVEFAKGDLSEKSFKKLIDLLKSQSAL